MSAFQMRDKFVKVIYFSHQLQRTLTMVFSYTPCKGIRILESEKHLPLELGIRENFTSAVRLESSDLNPESTKWNP